MVKKLLKIFILLLSANALMHFVFILFLILTGNDSWLFSFIISINNSIVILTSTILFVCYIIHIFRNPFLHENEKNKWLAAVFFASHIGMIFYWLKYLKPFRGKAEKIFKIKNINSYFFYSVYRKWGFYKNGRYFELLIPENCMNILNILENPYGEIKHIIEEKSFKRNIVIDSFPYESVLIAASKVGSDYWFNKALDWIDGGCEISDKTKNKMNIYAAGKPLSKKTVKRMKSLLRF